MQKHVASENTQAQEGNLPQLRTKEEKNKKQLKSTAQLRTNWK